MTSQIIPAFSLDSRIDRIGLFTETFASLARWEWHIGKTPSLTMTADAICEAAALERWMRSPRSFGRLHRLPNPLRVSPSSDLQGPEALSSARLVLAKERRQDEFLNSPGASPPESKGWPPLRRGSGLLHWILLADAAKQT